MACSNKLGQFVKLRINGCFAMPHPIFGKYDIAIHRCIHVDCHWRVKEPSFPRRAKPDPAPRF